MCPKLNDQDFGMKSGCDPKEVALKSFFLGPQSENSEWLVALVNEIFSHWSNWRCSIRPADGFAISASDRQSDDFLKKKRTIQSATREVLTRFENEVPKFSPRYVGHMFSETSLPALLGHIVTLLHNPNNISGESARVGVQFEEEAIQALRTMVGYEPSPASGHFTSGGTIANFEALIRARARMSMWFAVSALHSLMADVPSPDETLSIFRVAHIGWDEYQRLLIELKKHLPVEAELDSALKKWDFMRSNPYTFAAKIESTFHVSFQGPVFLVPENKHYSWKKAASLLGLGYDSIWPIALNEYGKLSIQSLRRSLLKAEERGRPVLMVVSVAGTTELGGIDPIDEVQEVLDEWRQEKGIHIWNHIDAAYGGFYRSLNLDDPSSIGRDALNALRAFPKSNSITLDPHKLGYVPYASGAILVRDEVDYRFNSAEDTPYIAFDTAHDRGPYTIEGSRSAAGAVATWMSAKTMGFNESGYGLLLERTTRICKDLSRYLEEQIPEIRIAPGGDTNILCFSCALPGEKISRSNQRTLEVYEAFSGKKKSEYIVSKTTLHSKAYQEYISNWTRSWDADLDAPDVVLIRMCLMNPFFGSKETKVRYAEHFAQSLKAELKIAQ